MEQQVHLEMEQQVQPTIILAFGLSSPILLR